MKAIQNTLHIAKALASFTIVSLLIIWVISENRLGYVYWIVALAIFLIGFFACAFILSKIKIAIKRNQGIYPRKGQETMTDVKRLALSNHKELAIHLYMDIESVLSKQAEQEIEKIIENNKKEK